MAPDPAAADEDDEPTAIVPATGAAARTPAEAAGQRWFDQRLQDFVHALACDADGRSRTTEARQALGAAAQTLIARVVNQLPADQPAADWPRDAALQPEQLLANTFQVRMLLASGGVGQIYRVLHRDLRSDHAVKILHPRFMLDPALTALLVQEAEMLAAVRHPGVVGSLGLLRDGDGRMLLVTDYVRGGTLAGRLPHGPMPPADLLALARGLLGALHAVHAAGVVHNDLAPDNIILRDDACADPVLVDFGLAQPIDAGAGPAAVQLDFAGKLSWVAPERLGGTGCPADARSDLYSLGLVLAAAAGGRRLPMGHDTETARAARATVPPLPGVPDSMRPAVTAMLQPAPRDRPASAAAALALLEGSARQPAAAPWQRIRNAFRDRTA